MDDAIGLAQRTGELVAVGRHHLDVEREAAALIALVDGIAIQATFDPRSVSAERQLEILDDRLSRLALASAR